MFDSKKLLDKLVNSGFAGGLAGGAAGAVVANALSGKKAKQYAGTALKAGGLALVGGVAYKAWQHYNGDKKTQEANHTSAFLPDSEQEQNELNLLLVKSMILASRADGNIDDVENQAIMSRIGEIQLNDSERAYLFEQFSAPIDLDALAREVTNEAHATEVYAVAAMILKKPSQAEQHYLHNLADALRLPRNLQHEIHYTLKEQIAA